MSLMATRICYLSALTVVAFGLAHAQPPKGGTADPKGEAKKADAVTDNVITA